MNSINVISINPANSAKSALHPEVFERIAREYSVTRETTKMNLSAKRVINFCFGINKKIGRAFSTNLLVARSLAGIALIGYAFFAGLSFAAFSPAWMMVILAVSLVLGLFNRFTSFAAAGYFGYLALTSAFSVSLLLPALIAVVSMLVGPGLFSIDQLLRRASFKYAKEYARAKAIKLAENRLSYRAMRYM
ncbi:MAG: hypothetical protein K2H76_06050 [Muribaculaceae bacterium]|nr:hypothetical protein [Muribaculaceae bacterium]